MTAQEQKQFELLPNTVDKARHKALSSAFVTANIPDSIVKAYCNR